MNTLRMRRKLCTTGNKGATQQASVIVNDDGSVKSKQKKIVMGQSLTCHTTTCGTVLVAQGMNDTKEKDATMTSTTLQDLN
jgi:hypothetical protein